MKYIVFIFLFLTGYFAYIIYNTEKSYRLTSSPLGTAKESPLPEYLPRKLLTMGNTDGRVTQKNIKTTICKSGYTKTVRNVPEAIKKQVFQNYGIDYSMHSLYEIDHLISLELGGNNDITNLWPEKYDIVNGAHDKDKIENKLKKEVCESKIKLKAAQDCIKTNWLLCK